LLTCISSVVALPYRPVLGIVVASSGAVVVELDELLELLELPDELLVPLPLEEVPEPVLPEPEVDDPLVVEELEVAAAAGRYITDRTSISIFRNSDRANSARSTSCCPVSE
jgi:hypothetical protein